MCSNLTSLITCVYIMNFKYFIDSMLTSIVYMYSLKNKKLKNFTEYLKVLAINYI